MKPIDRQFDVYSLQRLPISRRINKRVSPWHEFVYHGVCEAGTCYTNNKPLAPLRLRRSGRFIPKVWMPADNCVVVEKSLVADLLDKDDYGPVEFTALYDLPLPNVGDFSDGDRFGDQIESCPVRQLRQLVESLIDQPDFHKDIGTYVYLRNWLLMDLKLDDIEDREIVPGVYSQLPTIKAFTSESISIEHPVAYCTVLQIRDDLLSRLLAYLPPDYFHLRKVNTFLIDDDEVDYFVGFDEDDEGEE